MCIIRENNIIIILKPQYYYYSQPASYKLNVGDGGVRKFCVDQVLMKMHAMYQLGSYQTVLVLWGFPRDPENTCSNNKRGYY